MKRASKLRKADKQSGTKPNPQKNAAFQFVANNLYTITKLVCGIAALVFATVAYKRSATVIKNMVNADAKQLKEVITGEYPYIYYCDRGSRSENAIPKIFTELNDQRGSKVGFATVNCSHVLPSGKTLWERYKLKKEWRPTIWGTAPWMKTQQAGPSYLKDSKALLKFVDKVMAPKATEIFADKDFYKFCGFSKNTSRRAVSSDAAGTCMVALRGSQHSRIHADLEKRLVTTYPRVKLSALDAVKRRLSMERQDGQTVDEFGLKLFAVRNGTHHMEMSDPITWDYMNVFVATAVAAPLSEYVDSGASSGPIRIVKAPAVVAAEQTKKKARQDEIARQQQQQEALLQQKQAEEALRANSAEPEEQVNPEVEAEERRRRERSRREEMERQEREQMFESGEEHNRSDELGGGTEQNLDENYDEDDDEETVIEL